MKISVLKLNIENLDFALDPPYFWAKGYGLFL